VHARPDTHLAAENERVTPDNHFHLHVVVGVAADVAVAVLHMDLAGPFRKVGHHRHRLVADMRPVCLDIGREEVVGSIGRVDRVVVVVGRTVVAVDRAELAEGCRIGEVAGCMMVETVAGMVKKLDMGSVIDPDRMMVCVEQHHTAVEVETAHNLTAVAPAADGWVSRKPNAAGQLQYH